MIQELLFLLAGLMLINTSICFLLWVKLKNALFGLLSFYWCTIAITHVGFAYIPNPIKYPSFQSLIIPPLLIAISTVILFILLLKIIKFKRPLKRYFILLAVGLFFSIIAFKITKNFTIVTLPLTITNAIIYIHTWTLLKKSNTSFSFTQKLLITWTGFIFLHNTDYILLRPIESMETICHLIAHLSFLGFAILCPIAILENTLKENNEIKTKKEIAEKANEFKSLFLAKMSHELRTPLHIILGMTEQCLRSKNIDNYLFKKLDMIDESGKKLLLLVNEILDLELIEKGIITVEPEWFNLKKLELHIKNYMSTKLKNDHITYKIEINSSQDHHLYTDYKRLTQIIDNLISNAIKYTQEGEISITVSRNEQQSTFSISDTGIGIAKEDLKTIFECYKSANPNKNQDSIGLGLHICKELISLLKGTIDVKSQAKVGSTFTIQIPTFLKTPPDNKQNKSLTTLKPNLHINQPKILVCDDEPLNQLYAKMILEDKSKLDIAQNGTEALNLITKKHFDIIFLDIKLPDINGLDILTKLSHLESPNKNTAIIALTAQSLKSDKVKILNHGFTDYLTKPFNESQIINMILKHTQN